MRRSFAWLCSTLVFLTAPAVGAQSDADEHVQRGLELRRSFRDQEALAEFTLAYERGRSARALSQMALAEDALGRFVDAESHLREALRAADDPWVARNATHLKEALAELQTHLGTLDVSCDIAGAELWLDGQRIGPLPASIRHAAGPAVVDVRAPGYAPSHQTPAVDASERTRLVVALALVVRPESLSSRDPRDERPALAPSGRPPARSPQRSAAWIALGGAGLLLGAAGAASIVRQDALAKYNDDGQCFYGGVPREVRCAEAKSTFDASNALMIAGLVAGGVTGAVGAFLAFAAPPRAGAIAGTHLGCVAGLPPGLQCGVAF
jgi:hypothetical protein